MEKITLSIFVPCFNEEKNIIKTLDNINEAVQNINYEILIADDGSKDRTVEFVEEFKKKNPNLNIKIFSNETNKGLGFNYYATAHKALGTYYLQLMGDTSEPPNTIKKILDNLGKAEIVMAYFPGKNDKRSLVRKILSKAFVILLNIINCNNLKRYNGPAIHLLENVKMYGSGADGHGNHAELISILMTHKKKFIEVEVETANREEGSSKAFELKNLLSVGKSLIVIFLIRVNYMLKKVKIFKS